MKMLWKQDIKVQEIIKISFLQCPKQKHSVNLIILILIQKSYVSWHKVYMSGLSLVEKPEMMRQMPPYFDPRTMPYDQTGRFPAPRMPGPAEPMQRFPGTKP